MRSVVFGIRPSKLASAQLDEFEQYAKLHNANIEGTRKIITSKGDKDTQSPIGTMGPGIFIKELEKQLLDGKIDCAVHSLKDVPVKVADGTTLACFAPRADVRDCLVARSETSLSQLGKLQIATESPRRQALIKEMEPKVRLAPLRGNVDTRMKKLDNKEFDAMILAACGLKRIGFEHRISKYFNADTFIPAAGQGAIVAQIRDNDSELRDTLKNISHEETSLAVNAERKVLEELEIGCQTPFGVWGRFIDSEFVISVKEFIPNKDFYLHCSETGQKKDCMIITQKLIENIKKRRCLL